MSCIVIGLGQRAAGDDAAGLAVIDELQRRGTRGALFMEAALSAGTVQLFKARDTSVLLEPIPQAQRWIIVDAVLVDRDEVGQVRLLSAADLDRSARCSVSSHGISVAQALELRRALHDGEQAHSNLPSVQLVAIGIRQPRRYEDALSPEVQRGIQTAANLVESLCAQTARAARSARAQAS
jgi:hydrogenase maturation protease